MKQKQIKPESNAAPAETPPSAVSLVDATRTGVEAIASAPAETLPEVAVKVMDSLLAAGLPTKAGKPAVWHVNGTKVAMPSDRKARGSLLDSLRADRSSSIREIRNALRSRGATETESMAAHQLAAGGLSIRQTKNLKVQRPKGTTKRY